MPRGKAEQAEVIIPKLREAEVELGRGKTVAEAVKEIGVTEQTYYRWKKKYGGLRMDQAKRLKELHGYVESFNGKLRDELLEREAFDTLLEAKVLIERWRQHYITVRPHSALGYRPPAPEALQH